MMEYRVVLLRNGVVKRLMFKAKAYSTCILEFNKLKKENRVDFPVRFNNCGKIVPVKYELVFVKERKDSDENRFVRDEYGRLVEEIPFSPEWAIIDKISYDFEEKFFVFGYHHMKERFTLRDLIKKILLKGMSDKRLVKSIVVVHNKLVIRGDYDMDLILCKNESDAIRLHNKLFDVTKKTSIKNLFFKGILEDSSDISYHYDLIRDKTGWAYTKIRRLNTKP